MATKSSFDIELKEISPNYPSLQDESETPEESKQKPPQARPQIKNLPVPPVARPVSSNVTPVVNVSTTPPGPSFLEQQRLRNSVPQPVPISQQAERQDSQPVLPPGCSVVQCSGCRGMIQYPTGVSIVCCIACRATTATRPLVNIVCYYCKNSAYYPADNSHVRCRCGRMYVIRPA